MIAVDKAAPLAVSRKPGRFQDGAPSGGDETGDISAMGLPCRSTKMFSPPSTSENNPDARLRNSVNVTVFMLSPPVRSVHKCTFFSTECQEDSHGQRRASAGAVFIGDPVQPLVKRELCESSVNRDSNINGNESD
jgi:hypothetical protein